MTRARTIAITIAVTVLAVLVIGSVILLYRGFRQFRRQEARLNRLEQELDRYYALDPFPSEENVERIRENTARLREWRRRLLETLRQGQVEPEALTPANFNARLSDRKNRLVRQARQAGIPLPQMQDFALGFDRYAQGELPAPEDVPRLMQQLTMLDAICRVLLEERVHEIVLVRRQEFEDVGRSSTGPSRADRGPRRRGGEEPPEVTVSETDRMAGVLRPGDLWARYRFQVTFRAQEPALLNVLNRWAKMDLFVVVTSLAVSKEGEDVKLPPVRATPEPAALGETDVVEGRGETPAPGPVPVSRRERQVSGPEVSKPLLISVDLDVFNFAPP